MPNEQFTFPSTDGRPIFAYRWDPAGEPVRAAMIVHGMGEHVLRYEELARKLNEAGYVVYGHDHRGHGKSVQAGEAPGDLGRDGWPALVADIGTMAGIVRENHANLPILLIAHSMGSFATQQFLLGSSDRIDAVVLSGTGCLDLLEPALDLESELDLAMFNAPFAPARTDFDWLSRDESEVDKYIADPLCGFGLDIDSVKSMFVGARRLADPAEVARVRADLPVLIAVGSHDPVNAGLALATPLVDRLGAAGVEDVALRVYDNARHEIFNETNRAEVFADLLAWAGRTLKPAASIG
jgi:alpha-beta hydrolase superfamily lysophospholipase